jgi:PAS domain S-box-containing protein
MPPAPEFRVLVLAPTGRDGAVAAQHLGSANLAIVICRDVADLLGKLDDGAGVAVIAEEALRSHLGELSAWVAEQPTWSDFPFIVLTSGHLYARADAQRIQLLESLGNVSLLERPLSIVSLSSTVRAGLRARRRQYQTRAMLDDLKSTEERLRLFIEHAPAALVMLDREMRYLAVSRRWMNDFQLQDSIIGKYHYDVFPEIPADWREGHDRCLAGATESSPAGELVRVNGVRYWLRREVRPWRDNQGRIGGLVIGWEDITAGKQAEERQQILMREVLHRTKNLLAVIQSIAAGTFRHKDDPAHTAFQSRLHALANAHGLLTDAAGQGATLEDIVRGQLASFAGTISIDGPAVMLKPSAAQSFALLTHELATNASKYGALATPVGSVAVYWRIVRNGSPPKLQFGWRERGGPPVVKPSHTGFGSVLLTHAIVGLESSPIIDFQPEGLVYETVTELTTIQPSSGPGR